MATIFVLALLGTGGYAVASAPGREPTVPNTVTVTTTRTVEGRYRGRTARSWAHDYQRRTLQLHHARSVSTRLRRSLLASPSVTEAINLASVVYGYGPMLWRKARCESHLNPRAQNPSEAAGLFQFIPSTFASTPFGGFSIWSPYANALAAGWMHAHGRGGEWVCR